MISDRELLRHLLASLAFRSAQALRDAPAEFGAFRPCDTSMSSAEILAHMGNTMEWCCCLVQGQERPPSQPPADWAREVERFYTMLQQLDDYLATDQPLSIPIEKLVKGPIADALTHTGQLAMLRRICGAPMPTTNYFKPDMPIDCIAEMKAQALSSNR